MATSKGNQSMKAIQINKHILNSKSPMYTMPLLQELYSVSELFSKRSTILLYKNYMRT